MTPKCFYKVWIENIKMQRKVYYVIPFSLNNDHPPPKKCLYTCTRAYVGDVLCRIMGFYEWKEKHGRIRARCVLSCFSMQAVCVDGAGRCEGEGGRDESSHSRQHGPYDPFKRMQTRVSTLTMLTKRKPSGLRERKVNSNFYLPKTLRRL